MKEELLRIHIDITDTHELKSGDMTVRMVMFGGWCDSELFAGRIMSGAVDTQIGTGHDMTLSARYMLEGTDKTGQRCRLFLENTSLPAGGTRPVIYTDSAELKFLEDTELYGRLVTENNEFMIIIEREAENDG